MKKIYPRLKPTGIKWEGERIVGCQSTNHNACKGELWECKRCHKQVCWEEGSTDLFDYATTVGMMFKYWDRRIQLA